MDESSRHMEARAIIEGLDRSPATVTAVEVEGSFRQPSEDQGNADSSTEQPPVPTEDRSAPTKQPITDEGPDQSASPFAAEAAFRQPPEEQGNPDSDAEQESSRSPDDRSEAPAEEPIAGEESDQPESPVTVAEAEVEGSFRQPLEEERHTDRLSTEQDSVPTEDRLAAAPTEQPVTTDEPAEAVSQQPPVVTYDLEEVHIGNVRGPAFSNNANTRNYNPNIQFNINININGEGAVVLGTSLALTSVIYVKLDQTLYARTNRTISGDIRSTVERIEFLDAPVAGLFTLIIFVGFSLFPKFRSNNRANVALASSAESANRPPSGSHDGITRAQIIDAVVQALQRGAG
ncbi:hypothetical protein C8J56DRAFT_940512 [Mycena floridula]|nr:hypothetical protein C8J56DRAFT_940512 [Mycena floridula]